MMSPEMHQLLQSFEDIGEPLCQRLSDYLCELGVDRRSLPRIAMQGLSYNEQRDPYSGEVSLQGEWRTSSGQLCGSLSFRSDGSLYVEHDVLLPHPTDQRWIIESITAWGTPDKLKLEPRLMAALED